MSTPSPPRITVVRVKDRASWRVPVRYAGACAAGVVALLAVGVISLSSGDLPVAVPEVVRTLLGGGNRLSEFAVVHLRLPRVVIGVLVGAALGMSGALTQTFARNPLASPDVLGVTYGASAGAVVLIVASGTTGTLASSLSGVTVSFGALLGALLTAAALYLLAWRGGVDGTRFVLTGIGCGAVLSALTSWMLVRAQVWEASRATVWLTGSLLGRTWSDVLPLAVVLAAVVPGSVLIVRSLRALQLGDDTAVALGTRLHGAQSATLLLAVLLACFAVAAAGPVGFVALAVPQIALRVTGASRPPILASAIFGAVLVVAADLVARVVLPGELPVGVLTAAIGAPYLIWLLIRMNRRAV